MVYIVRSSNAEVTDFYLDTIADIFKDSGEEIYDKSYKLEQCKKQDIIVVPTVTQFVKVYSKGFRNICYWMQGIDAEESFMKHRSKLRKWVLDTITRFALKRAKAIFYVSNAMKEYEEKKFRLNTDKKSFIMPCFNVSCQEGVNFDKSKYEKNIFSYVGSLSKWQCFSETIDFYKQLENQYPDVELRVFTFSAEEAEKVLKDKQVKKYSVSTVSPDKMTDALKNVKFGFVLREDTAVNNVATPTKLSSYLSAGVIPIFSECIIDFYNRTKTFEYVVPVKDNDVIPDKLYSLMSNEVDFEHLCEEYSLLFSTYYNPQYYKEKFKDKLKEVMR